MAAVACPAGVYRVDENTADRIRAGTGAVSVWIIDGSVANSRADFFRALAAALKFPDYFGHNWDAVYDCLTDLASADARPAVLLITGGDEFVAGMGPAWETGQRVFADAAAFWQRGDRLLLVLLASDVALPALSKAPASCLEHAMPLLDKDGEITLADARINTLNRSGRFADALQLGQDLVARFPNDGRAYFVLGGAFDYQGQEVEAVPPYQRAWELGLSGVDVPMFYVQYGSTLRNVGQFAEAVRVLQEGHARFPDNVAIQAFLALALLSAGRAAEALATALTIVIEDATASRLHGYERALREYVAALQPPDGAHETAQAEANP